MTVELYINGHFNRSWNREDIREEATEAGGKRWKFRVEKMINKIKEVEEVFWLMQYNEFEFFVVMESAASDFEVTDQDLREFEKQRSIKRVDRIVRKYKKAG